MTLTLAPSGIIIKECQLHQRDSRWWIGLPSKAQVDSEGRHKVDPETGKRLYFPIIEIKGEARRRFQEAALAAIDKLLGDAR